MDELEHPAPARGRTRVWCGVCHRSWWAAPQDTECRHCGAAWLSRPTPVPAPWIDAWSKEDTAA